MPRKKNKRKAIQIAKRKAEVKPKSRRVAAIGHYPTPLSGIALAALVAGSIRNQSN